MQDKKQNNLRQLTDCSQLECIIDIVFKQTEWGQRLKMISRFLRRMRDRWQGYKANLALEFFSHISELITNEKVLSLDDYTQHFIFSRLRHSIDVAYFSFFICRFLGWDARSAARGGLLHDLFFYDWRDEDYVCDGKNHATEHPKIALRNAQEICTLNKIEENIILRHMWLITAVPPKYKEGFVVTFVDKYCAFREFLVAVTTRKKNRRSFFVTLV